MIMYSASTLPMISAFTAQFSLKHFHPFSHTTLYVWEKLPINICVIVFIPISSLKLTCLNVYKTLDNGSWYAMTTPYNIKHDYLTVTWSSAYLFIISTCCPLHMLVCKFFGEGIVVACIYTACNLV